MSSQQTSSKHRLHLDSQVDKMRQKWLAYLREPELKQARHKLQRVSIPEARCCLGHACVLFAEPQGTKWFGDQRYIVYGRDEQPSILPRDLAKRLDVTQRVHFTQPRYIPCKWPDDTETEEHITSAVELNDCTPLSLHEIADVLEDQMRADNLLTFAEETHAS